MVIVSSLAYNLRLSKLAITSLIDENTNVNVDEGYLKALFANGGANSDITDTAGDFSFETTVNSITPGFYPKNTNVALYQAEPYIISHNLTHNFINSGSTEYVKNIILNRLPNDTYVGYDDNLKPLNVPYVKISTVCQVI